MRIERRHHTCRGAGVGYFLYTHRNGGSSPRAGSGAVGHARGWVSPLLHAGHLIVDISHVSYRQRHRRRTKKSINYNYMALACSAGIFTFPVGLADLQSAGVTVQHHLAPLCAIRHRLAPVLHRLAPYCTIWHHPEPSAPYCSFLQHRAPPCTIPHHAVPILHHIPLSCTTLHHSTPSFIIWNNPAPCSTI